jgi:hypothetical protein
MIDVKRSVISAAVRDGVTFVATHGDLAIVCWDKKGAPARRTPRLGGPLSRTLVRDREEIR